MNDVHLRISNLSKGNRMKSSNLKGGDRILSGSDDDEFESLFDQETVYRHSRMLAHITMKASIQGPQNQHFPHEKPKQFARPGFGKNNNARNSTQVKLERGSANESSKHNSKHSIFNNQDVERSQSMLNKEKFNPESQKKNSSAYNTRSIMNAHSSGESGFKKGSLPDSQSSAGVAPQHLMLSEIPEETSKSKKPRMTVDIGDNSIEDEDGTQQTGVAQSMMEQCNGSDAQ